MKKLKSIITVLVFAIALQFSQAQEEIALENSLLWKIEHPKLETPSYLLGTLHLMCEADFAISEKVMRTLKNVDALVLEVNQADPSEMKIMMESMNNPKKISEQLSKEQFQRLDSLTQKEMGATLSNFDQYGLSTFNFILISKMLPCTQMKSSEVELMQLAKTNDKTIDGIEKVTEQMDYIEQAYPIDFTFEQTMLFEDYKRDFNNAIKFYKKEELINSVNLIRKEAYMNENATKYLLTVRNNNWVDIMPEMMTKRSNLFAFGAAHLTRENGVIHLLRQKGYTVTPVMN